MAEQAGSAAQPAPLSEHPPADRYADVVLNGGVASGVVYPWALLELARAFRFRNIGGTSVGAVAAALTAAAEYSRRHGSLTGFEVLRQVPLDLAREVEPGRTRMISLFQPTVAAGRRPLDLLIRLMTLLTGIRPGQAASTPAEGLQKASRGDAWRLAFRALALYWPEGLPWALPILVALALSLCWIFTSSGNVSCLGIVLSCVGALLCALLAYAWGALRGLYRDVMAGLVRPHLGLCSGRRTRPDAGYSAQDDQSRDDDGFVDWMHRGIQKAAGREFNAPPLTFKDLWSAPLVPGGPPNPCSSTSPPSQRSINLEVMSTWLTPGHPVRWPQSSSDLRIFYDPQEWAAFFPCRVLDWLEAHSQPYVPKSVSDPPLPPRTNSPPLPPSPEPIPPDPQAERLRELPLEHLPVVVAARMSMSFPVLFAAVPVWTVDYRVPRAPNQPARGRLLRRTHMTDGGLCANFPIHLFDAALPRWPTFGFYLDQRDRLKQVPDERADVWLPNRIDDGRSVRFFDFDKSAPETWGLATLWGFGVAMFNTMQGWSDQTRMRQVHMRERVVRLGLKPEEGQLHIAMPSDLIRNMAWRHGVESGTLQVRRHFEPGSAPQAPGDTAATQVKWRRHLVLRWVSLIAGLKQHLASLPASAQQAPGHSISLQEALVWASQAGSWPVKDTVWDAPRPMISEEDLAYLQTVQPALEALAQALRTDPEALQAVAWLTPKSTLGLRPDF